MSREDDVKTLSAGLHEFTSLIPTNARSVAHVIANFVDARMWEVMVAHVTSAVHVPAPVEPEPTAAKTWRCTMCGGDHPTGKSHTQAVALQAQGERLQRDLEKATAVMLEAAGVTKPAAVGPEPPERVTLYIAQDGDWWKFQTSDPMTPEMPAVTYVRASAYEKAVELLRSAVERWPSYNVRDDVVAFLAEHDAAARKT